QFMHLCSLGWQSVFIAKWNQPYYPPVNHNAAGRLKDTATNLKSGQGFAMNIISEAFIENTNVTAVDTPPEFDEWALSGLTKEKCIRVQNKSLARQGKREMSRTQSQASTTVVHPRGRQVLPCTFLGRGRGLGFLVCFSFLTTSGSLPTTISVTMIPVLWETLMWVPSVLFEHSYTKALQINVYPLKGMSERRIVDEFDE
ncbi:hypothetical protein BDR06DRAFT_955642, partial [Suillus hirtellus]